MPSSRPVRRTESKGRRAPWSAPVRAWAMAEWALLPLRVFLGVTFAFAGLQKLANPTFFNPKNPSGMQAQFAASIRVSPLHALLAHLQGGAKPLGIALALSELAIGLGALLGLWTRIAALGGVLMSLILFLTVSFHATPFYTGADIVFLFAWLPLVVSGGGTRLSLDAWLAKRVTAKLGAPNPELVAVPFARVQSLCGHFTKGHCAARAGLACESSQCPVLIGERAPLATRVTLDTIDRRTLVLGSTAAAVVGGATLVLGGAAADIGKMVGNAHLRSTNGIGNLSTTTTAGPTTTTTPGTATTTSNPNAIPGTKLGPAKSLAVGESATFTVPSTGDPGVIIATAPGQFVAYDSVCPHAGCQVGYYAQSKSLVCPCHGSQFQVATGDVISGPAPQGLTKLHVVEGPDGYIYLQ